MGLMDRVREQAAQVAQRTAQATQEAAQQGKAKLDQAQAKRRADAMFRDLGAAVYAERTGRGGTDTADKIDTSGIKLLLDQSPPQFPLQFHRLLVVDIPTVQRLVVLR